MNRTYICNEGFFENRKKLGGLSLVQLGRVACDGGYIMSRHTHLDWFELTVAVDGEGRVETNGKSVGIKKGDVHLSFPCDIHAIYSSEEAPLTYDFIAFVPESAKLKKAFEELSKQFYSAEKRTFRAGRVRSLSDGCIKMFVSDDSEKFAYASLALKLMCMETLRAFENTTADVSDEELSNDMLICNSVRNYIDTHIYSIKSLSELSEVTSYNYSYLSAVFKNVTGSTIFDYYKHRRFESAKALLGEGTRKITEISNLLGYNSVYAFSKAFKDQTGFSPKKYLSVATKD